ncbi:MAG: hypothetical protein JNM68_11200, partial [Dinghuibacter sp.]|nr:hypothetical protein [Dinghuibacter sp.]
MYCINKNGRLSSIHRFGVVLFFLCAFSGFFSMKANAQGCPPNLDFEMGTFDNWQCYTGNTTVLNGQNVINLNPVAPTAGRHEIISAATGGIDPYGGFPTICPYGGNYSVKLGNAQSGSQAEALSYTFTVPANQDTFTFTYFYAVVFQNPNHNIYEQPRFFVTAYDVLTGNLISCASYDYVSTSGIPGFQVSPVNNTVLFKKWSPVSIQFAGLANRQVRLEFRTGDCTRGGHFGYAYLDVSSGCTDILATAPYCVETNSLVLNAPYGFQSYTWYNNNYTQVLGTGQSITLSPPPATSGIFYVDMVPYPGYGCRDTAGAVVTPFPVPDTPVAVSYYEYCQNAAATPLTATALPAHDLYWYATPTGGTPSTVPFLPPTNVPGIFEYYVIQKTLFGCESKRKKITVNVIPIP